MKRTAFLTLIALMTVFALALTGCGGKDTPETAAPNAGHTPPAASEELSLSGVTLTTSTWSSPNGATVHLSALPAAYETGLTAAFLVRLDGIEVESIPCQWDGAAFTANAELNAADGYSYYVVLTDAAGAQAEIPVNTPEFPADEALLNMASSLQSFCNLTVTESASADGKLTITAGAAELQLPRISNQGETITCKSAVLVLTFEGAEVAAAEVDLSQAGPNGGCEADLAGTVFPIPALENDQQLALRLDVTLSNNQTLTCPGGTWFYNDGDLLLAVG